MTGSAKRPGTPRHPDTVMPRACGASSTPRPIVSIIDASGTLDHPPSRVMTPEYDFAFSRRICARGLHLRWPSKVERAQGRPGARCTRGLVCKVRKRRRTRAYRFSGEHPAFPAQWVDGLYRDLPGETRSVATIARSSLAAANLTPASGVRTTRLRRTRQPRSSVAASASTASHRAFVTIAIRPSHRVRRAESSH